MSINKPTRGKSRKPVAARQPLAAKQRDGYVRRFVNDELGQVEDFGDAGWAAVLVGDQDISEKRAQNASQLGSVVRRVVNRDPRARCQYAVLMEIPVELYQEDQRTKHAELDASDKLLDPALNKVAGTDYGSMTTTRK